MKQKLLVIIFILAVYVSNAQNNVTVDVGAAWSGYMNWFDNPADPTPDCGGGFCEGFSWALADLKTTIGASDITLQPNFQTYNAADAYWADGALGNKIMEASTYVEPGGSFNGVDLTFSGSVLSNTLDAGYVATFWIKALDPDDGFADALGGSKVVTLPTSGNFTVSATGAELASGLIIQYGFTIYGLNANPVDEAALGSVVVTETQPIKVWDFGNDNTTWEGALCTVDCVPGITGVAATTYIDQLVLVPADATDFGKINNSNADFSIFSGETYTAFQRFQMAGGSSPSGFMPTRRYLYFTVDGPCSVKVYFKTGSNGQTRTLYVSDGTSLIENGSETTNDSGTGGTNGDLAILSGSYTGSGGTLYVYNDPACNLYKIEVNGANVTTPTLGINDKASLVSTNIKAVGNRIYVSNVKTSTEVNIYSITGALVKSLKTNTDTDFSFRTGLYIATVKTEEGQKAVKLLTY